MTIEECNRKYNNLKVTTNAFLIEKDKILLGLKKTGFGKGKIVGIGGKVNPNESLKECAIREIYEEIGVVVTHLKQCGYINFYFPYVQNPEEWNLKVLLFKVSTWENNPKESEEIKPQWFYKKNIPYNRMWSDASIWMPEFLNDKKIKGNFIFKNKEDILTYSLGY